MKGTATATHTYKLYFQTLGLTLSKLTIFRHTRNYKQIRHVIINKNCMRKKKAGAFKWAFTLPIHRRRRRYIKDGKGIDNPPARICVG